MKSTVKYALGAAAVLAAVPADAATLELEPSSEWQLRADDDKCRATRNFGAGDDAVALWIEQGGAEASFNLTLIGRPLRHPYGGGIRLKFGDEPEFIRSYIAAESSKGRPVLRMYGVTLFQPKLEKGTEQAAPNMRIEKERLNAISTLHLRSSIVQPIKLELGSMEEPFAFLSECGWTLSAVLTEAGRPLSGEARAPVPIKPDRWLKMRNWPAYLQRANMGAQVVARLSVNKQGRPGSCVITETNKPQLFDDAVCSGLLRSAKFEPALNAERKPVSSYYFYTVNFVIR